MRISTLKDDPGYQIDAHFYEVYLDGNLVNNCLMADDQTNQLTIMVTDQDLDIDLSCVVKSHSLSIDKHYTVTVTGKIEILKRKEA